MFEMEKIELKSSCCQKRIGTNAQGVTSLSTLFLVVCLVRHEQNTDCNLDLIRLKTFVPSHSIFASGRFSIMVRYYENETLFKFNWEKVATAFWCRYPNPER